MATLPSIDFAEIEDLAKSSIQQYGTPATFIRKNGGQSLSIKTVAYRDNTPEDFLLDANEMPARALIDPDDMDGVMPEKFDKLVINIGGFKRTYIIQDAHPVYAENTLPIIIVSLRTG